jgi:hypothetical protein
MPVPSHVPGTLPPRVLRLNGGVERAPQRRHPLCARRCDSAGIPAPRWRRAGTSQSVVKPSAYASCSQDETRRALGRAGPNNRTRRLPPHRAASGLQARSGGLGGGFAGGCHGDVSGRVLSSGAGQEGQREGRNAASRVERASRDGAVDARIGRASSASARGVDARASPVGNRRTRTGSRDSRASSQSSVSCVTNHALGSVRSSGVPFASLTLHLDPASRWEVLARLSRAAPTPSRTHPPRPRLRVAQVRIWPGPTSAPGVADLRPPGLNARWRGWSPDATLQSR